MLNSIPKINKNLKRLAEISTNLFTPVQHLERMDGTHNEYLKILEETPVLLGMFSDDFKNANTVFKDCHLLKDITNRGGNYTWYICRNARKVEIENGMNDLQLATTKTIVAGFDF